MQGDRNYIFLVQALSRVLPEVFSHPVWVQFARDTKTYSADLIQDLYNIAQSDQIVGDPVSRCQVFFLCAYLQSRLDNHVAAKEYIQHAWDLAETYSLPQIARCAAWGVCAVCICQGKYREAVDWLIQLQMKLNKTGESILADILDVFRQTLEQREQAPGSNEELFDSLLRWGEWFFTTTPDHGSRDLQSGQARNYPAAGMFSRLAHYWGSFWRSINRIARSKQHSQHDASLSDNLQMLSGISNLSSPLLQSKINTFSLSSPLQHKQPGLSSLAVYCLGTFRVFLDDQLIANWPSGKGKAIFKHMVANLGRPIHKDVLMDTFWREADLEAARKNLYVAIYGLRQAFRALQPDFSPLLFQDDHYLFNPALAIWVDVEEFTQHFKAGQSLERRGMLLEAVKEYELAESLYQGDFLEEDLYEDWPIPRREGLKDSYLAILDRLSRFYLEEKKYSTCIQLCRKILDKDDCREDAHRRLMRCYSWMGQRNLALRQYHLCVEALSRALDVPPLPVTVALYHQIRNGEVA